MPTWSTVAARQLSDGNPQGTVLGRSSTDAIGFYGQAPVVQPVGATSVVSSVANSTLAAQAASSGGFGFSTAADFGSYMSTVVQLQTDVAALFANVNAFQKAFTSTGLTRGS